MLLGLLERIPIFLPVEGARRSVPVQRALWSSKFEVRRGEKCMSGGNLGCPRGEKCVRGLCDEEVCDGVEIWGPRGEKSVRGRNLGVQGTRSV